MCRRLSPPSSAFPFVRLEAHLQDAIAQRVPVYVLDGDHRLVVVRHGDEAEAAALVRFRIADHLHREHRSERPEQLPQHVLLRFRRQIVDEQTPARIIRGGRGRCGSQN